MYQPKLPIFIDVGSKVIYHFTTVDFVSFCFSSKCMEFASLECGWHFPGHWGQLVFEPRSQGECIASQLLYNVHILYQIIKNNKVSYLITVNKVVGWRCTFGTLPYNRCKVGVGEVLIFIPYLIAVNKVGVGEVLLHNDGILLYYFLASLLVNLLLPRNLFQRKISLNTTG